MYFAFGSYEVIVCNRHFKLMTFEDWRFYTNQASECIRFRCMQLSFRVCNPIRWLFVVKCFNTVEIRTRKKKKEKEYNYSYMVFFFFYVTHYIRVTLLCDIHWYFEEYVFMVLDYYTKYSSRKCNERVFLVIKNILFNVSLCYENKKK